MSFVANNILTVYLDRLTHVILFVYFGSEATVNSLHIDPYPWQDATLNPSVYLGLLCGRFWVLKFLNDAFTPPLCGLF